MNLPKGYRTQSTLVSDWSKKASQRIWDLVLSIGQHLSNRFKVRTNLNGLDGVMHRVSLGAMEGRLPSVLGMWQEEMDLGMFEEMPFLVFGKWSGKGTETLK